MAREPIVAGLGTALGYAVLYGGPVYRAAAAAVGWAVIGAVATRAPRTCYVSATRARNAAREIA